jgi:FkbM family methyltransferase
MNPGRKELLGRLDLIERLARAPRWRRLLHQPARYLSATLFHRFLYPRFSSGWRRTALTFFDQPLQVVLPAATDIFLLGAKTHDSEIRLARFMIRHLKAGATFVDVGAHYGFYALLAARLTGVTGRVIALEASPRTFESLNVNLQASPHALALHCAAGDHNGTLTFYEFPTLYSEYNSTEPSSFEHAGWKDNIRPEAVEVPCRRLDDLLAERNLQPDFIKIDVEGAENQVARGMEGWLKQARHPLIAMEYLADPALHTPHREALALLQTYGLQAFVIDYAGNLQPSSDVAAHLRHRQLDSDNIVLAKEACPSLTM